MSMKLARTLESIYGDFKIWCHDANIEHRYLIEFEPYRYNFVGERDDTLPRNSYSIHITWVEETESLKITCVRDNKKNRNHWVDSYLHVFQGIVDNLIDTIKQLERTCA